MYNYMLMRITKLIFFILCFTGIQSIAQEPAVTRLDKSRISFSDLDDKIQALMKAANVQGMAITIFNNKKAIYKKHLVNSNAGQPAKKKSWPVFSFNMRFRVPCGP